LLAKLQLLSDIRKFLSNFFTFVAHFYGNPICQRSLLPPFYRPEAGWYCLSKIIKNIPKIISFCSQIAQIKQNYVYKKAVNRFGLPLKIRVKINALTYLSS